MDKNHEQEPTLYDVQKRLASIELKVNAMRPKDYRRWLTVITLLVIWALYKLDHLGCV